MLIQDIKPHREACGDCQHIDKLHRGLASHGRLEEDKAVLVVFNEQVPHKSHILVERFELEEKVECSDSPIGIHFMEYKKMERQGLRLIAVLRCANCGSEERYSRGKRVS